MATIQTPRGTIVTGKNGKAELVWSTTFASRWTQRYNKAQVFLDSEVLRRCEPFIPLRTGSLIKSGILGTTVGSGLVQWIAPYARRQYYHGRQPGVSSTGPLRGRRWFDRMKAANLTSLINGVRKFMSGGSNG